MAFEPKKFNDIVEDMQGRISGLSDFEVGSVTRTLVETFSYELGLLYEKMRLVYLSAFIDSAEGINLEQVVAVLGIKRGLPDYATGAVSFERDRGNDDILIPLGALVATEEKADKPKKVYQTIEEKTLRGAEVSVEIKVQALERGEEQDAAEGEIVVMPRPVPGIKAVTNKGKVRLAGKQRETDEELRERAKNALISAGKATILSIENALLSQPDVLDVKVREDFLFPQGTALLTRKTGVTGDVTVPRHSRIWTSIGGQEKVLRTKTEVFLKAGLNQTNVALQSELEGRLGEIPEAELLGVSWQFVKPETEGQVEISDMRAIALSEFGIIDVFVDGPDLGNPEQRSRISAAIDRVKAAGIYVRLDSAQPVYVDGIFRIDVDARQNLDAEELAQLEDTVARAIRDFLHQTKMGSPLLFSRLLKEVLSVEGVENLADFRIYTEALRYEGQRKEYLLSANKIESEESERFKYRDICVAAADKLLPVDVEIHVDGLDDSGFSALEANLIAYTDTLAQGALFVNSDLLGQLLNGTTGLTLHPATLRLSPRPWCDRGHLFTYDTGATPQITGVNVSFVEKATAGRLFAYSHFLEITGALRIALPANLPLQKANRIRAEVQEQITAYLNSLGPEDDVALDEMVVAALKVEGVAQASWEADDFRAEKLSGNVRTPPLADRIREGKIEVDPFEKAVLRPNAFCIAYRTEQVEVTVAKLELALQTSGVDATVKNELKTLTANIVSHFLDNAQPGDDLDFNALRTAVENRLPAAPAIVKALDVEAKSAVDGRLQTVSITNPLNIHIRSVELARMTPFSAANVVLIDP